MCGGGGRGGRGTICYKTFPNFCMFHCKKHSFCPKFCPCSIPKGKLIPLIHWLYGKPNKDHSTLNVGQFGPWTIRTLVNSDLNRTSAMGNSDLGQFGPESIRTLTTGLFGPHKNKVCVSQCPNENKVRINQGRNENNARISQGRNENTVRISHCPNRIKV